MIRIGFVVVLVGVLGWSVVAQANPIPIYNTGSNTSGNTTGGLLPVASADPHWQIISTPTSSTPTSAIVDSTIAPGWATNPGYSQWIGQSYYQGLGVPGDYSFQTTFNLSGVIPLSAVLNGSIAVDNCLVDILINGVSTGTSSASCAPGQNFGSFLNFTISSGFVSGVNTLTFEIHNLGTTTNPTGLNVVVSGNALPLPEPGSLGLLGLALLGFGGMWIRRRTC